MMDPVGAHEHSSDNRADLESGGMAGCFYCLDTFPTDSISEWIDEGQTAMCPRCGIDSVIGADSGYYGIDFLREMYDYWFARGETFSMVNGKLVKVGEWTEPQALPVTDPQHRPSPADE